MKILVAPSILSADFSRLAEDIRKVQAAGADLLHVDVMDGHFVPNITIGPAVVKDIRKVTSLALDVHLMIEDPLKFADAFVKAGSDMLTVHIETVTIAELKLLRRKLAAAGVKLGISLNPPTAFNRVKPALSLADFVLVMSVNPGFGGQEFIPGAIDKIRRVREVFKGDIAVDGGINAQTGAQVVGAGANILAAGSYIFKAKSYSAAIRSLKCAANR
jgi:ribulose-phosphate 3-epimerase